MVNELPSCIKVLGHSSDSRQAHRTMVNTTAYMSILPATRPGIYDKNAFSFSYIVLLAGILGAPCSYHRRQAQIDLKMEDDVKKAPTNHRVKQTLGKRILVPCNLREALNSYIAPIILCLTNCSLTVEQAWSL